METPRRNWQVANSTTLVCILVISASTFFLARPRKAQLSSAPQVHFREVAGAAALTFEHRKPLFDPRVANIMPWLTAVGASASAADYENSGRVAVFFTNSAAGSEDALYRNEGQRDGVPQFRDVTAESGLAGLNLAGASMAAAWGDYDNDGYPDLYVLRAGARSLLFHNVPMLDARGNPIRDARGVARRKFVDVTDTAGVGSFGYAVGAVWFDYDRDGLLDLLVADYFPAVYLTGRSNGKRLDLWRLESTRFMPESFNDARNGGGVLLFHNLGNGRFVEVSHALGLTHTGWALAVGAADLNNDGWPDIYVANDFGPDDLYVNQPGPAGSRRFVRMVGGYTADKIGRDTKKGMNVDFGDFDHRGALDIYVTNITQRNVLPEGNMLWASRPDPSRPGGRNFVNVADNLGVNACGWSWAAKFADVNNDGWLDLFVVNGMISADPRKSYWYELQNMASDYRAILADAASWPVMADKSLSGYQRSCLFVRTGGSFVDLAPQAGIEDTLDGRGIALGDFDNDGAPDFIVANQGQRVLFYLNELYRNCHPGQCPGWIGFRLVGNGSSSNRDAIGARVELYTNEGVQLAEVSRGNGFASQNDPRVRFGLGLGAHVLQARIIWPDGREQKLVRPAEGVYHEIYEAR